MTRKRTSKLDRKKRYLQIALNSTLSDAKYIIQNLPRSDRIIIEAGTPFIKRYGESGIRKIKDWYGLHLLGQPIDPSPNQRQNVNLIEAFKIVHDQYKLNLPGVKYLYPGLSPGGRVPGIREDNWDFCRWVFEKRIQAGRHCYL